MKINRNNYEAFLLDLSEGNLSDELQNELSLFLASNPDLDAEYLDDIDRIIDDSTAVIDKDLLNFETINAANRKHFFIAYHEGDLNTSEQNNVLNFISENSQFNNEFKQFSKLYLKSNAELFEDKQVLHSIASSNTNKGLLYWSTRIAAILLIGFILTALLQDRTNISPKYSLENVGSELNPTIHNVGFADITNELIKKDSKENNLGVKRLPQTNSKNYISDNTSPIKLEKPKSEAKDNEPNKTPFNSRNEIIIESPDLSKVIASLNPIIVNDKDSELESLPTKKLDTPPSLLAFLGDKAKEKEILTENGRPNILSLINKGSKTITGQDVLAQTETEQTNSTVFRLGGLKIERISKK